MSILPKQIWEEEFTYYSDKSIDEFRMDIQQLLHKSKEWDFSINLTGAFISEFEFEMTPKWQSSFIKNYERSISYLKGQIHTDAFKRTLVTFTVRPNYIVLIFSFLSAMFGIFALSPDNIKGDVENARIAQLVFIFVIPVLTLAFGYFVKQEIKNTFVKTFNLKSIE
jgi:hypothetical protein